MKPNPADMTTFWRSILIIIILFAFLVLTLNALRTNLSYRSFAKSAGPTKILLTDITKDGAVVVYHTDTAEPTLVKYQTSGLDQIATDILGTRPLKNHLARLVNLTPGSIVPIEVAGQKISLKTLPQGDYRPLQAKVITGIIPSEPPQDWTDTVVVLQTNDHYFATRSDASGNWLISWVNGLSPDGIAQIVAPIYDTNIIIYPPESSVYQFPFAWGSVNTITASIITPKAPDLAPETFWDKVRKFLLTFIPNFSLLTSNS